MVYQKYIEKVSLQSNNTSEKGKSAENKAEKYLVDAGYSILERNFRTKFGELDIIAIDMGSREIVFVEVRSSSLNIDIDSLMNNNKIRKLKRIVIYWLNTHNKTNSPFRIDFIAIVLDNINHIKSAII